MKRDAFTPSPLARALGRVVHVVSVSDGKDSLATFGVCEQAEGDV